MNLSEILRRVRNLLEDTHPTNPKWDNQELVDYINQVENDVCQITRCIVDATTTVDVNLNPVCQIPIISGTALYSLHDTIINVNNAWYGTTKFLLEPYDVLNDIEKWNNSWQTTTGIPCIYALDFTSRKIRLYPVPNANSTMYLSVIRRPLVPFSISSTPTLLELAKTPEIQSLYHEYLINGVLTLCYLKDDEDTVDIKKSQYYQQLFQLDIIKINYQEVRHYYHDRYVGIPAGFF